MTREEAVKCLRECKTCRRWGTGVSCDGCAVDRMPPTADQTIAALNRAVALGREAEKLREQLRGILK